MQHLARGYRPLLLFVIVTLLGAPGTNAFQIRWPTSRRWTQHSFTAYVMPYSVGYDSSSYASAIERAVPSINAIPGYGFSISTSRQRVQESASDDTTTVTFHRLISGNLAEITRDSVTVNGVTYWNAVDIVFDQNRSDWEDEATLVDKIPPYSNHSIFEVARHELVHGIGLDHEDYRVAVMNSVYSYSCEAPKLHADDRNGLRTIYPGSSTEYDLALSGWWIGPGGEALPNPSPYPKRINGGDSFTADVLVENLGTETVGTLDLHFYLSTSASYNDEAYDLGGVEYPSFPGAKGGANVVASDRKLPPSVDS